MSKTKVFNEGVEVKQHHPLVEKIVDKFKSAKKKVNKMFDVEPDKGFF